MKPRRRLKKPSTAEETRDPYPRASVAWGNVIEDVLRIDNPAATHAQLAADLELGENRADYGALLVAADKAASNRYLATRLHRVAKLEDERYAGECEERLEILRTNAREEIGAEHAEGKHKGAITKQQIEDRMLANWPEEYRTIRARMSRMHGTAQALEGLVEAWNHRCITLNKMLERAALGRIVSGGGN